MTAMANLVPAVTSAFKFFGGGMVWSMNLVGIDIGGADIHKLWTEKLNYFVIVGMF